VLGRSNTGAVFFNQGLLAHPRDVDLVVLKFAATDVPFLKLGQSADAVEGQRVLVIGNPEGLQGTVSDGIIAAIRENRSIMQITAPISPGSSGSPVLDENGIGVATIQYVEGQNLNFAIPVEWVTAALNSRDAQPGLQGQTAETALASPPAASPPVITPSPSVGEPTPDLTQFVKDLIESGNLANPEVETSFYADEVDYFDNGKVTKAFILEDMKKYDQRWPMRRYWLDGEPKVRIVDSGRDIAEAVVRLQFVAQNGRKTVWGSCENLIFIQDASTNPKVMYVRSKLLSRHQKPEGR